MKLLEIIPRRSLLWLSRDDVKRVRNSLIATYLSPSEKLYMLPANGNFGVSMVYLSGSVCPCFEWNFKGIGMEKAEHIKAWLKVRSGLTSYWDVQIGPTAFSAPFRYLKVRPAADLVVQLSQYWPFPPRENFLENKGECIA